MAEKIIIIAGPTASGKSACALHIAKQFDSVIINADSKQVFREIPLITAQPTKEEKELVEHDLYSNISAAEHCSLARWVDMAIESIERALAKNKLPILVGGSGMYINGLTEGFADIPSIQEDVRTHTREMFNEIGNTKFHKELEKLDPIMAKNLNIGDSQRIMRAYEVVKQTGKSLHLWQKEKSKPRWSNDCYLKFFLSPKREEVYNNCNLRFVKMIEEGVIEEVKKLDDMNLDDSLPAMKAHGVPEIRKYLKNELTLEEAIDKSQQNTRNYIKRQFTWFKSQMKNTIAIDKNYNDILANEISRFILKNTIESR